MFCRFPRAGAFFSLCTVLETTGAYVEFIYSGVYQVLVVSREVFDLKRAILK